MSAPRLSPGTEANHVGNMTEKEVPGVLEYYEGRLLKVKDANRSGWWRFHEHYDRNGYCDNPARGY